MSSDRQQGIAQATRKAVPFVVVLGALGALSLLEPRLQLLGSGILATILMLLTALFGLRRRFPALVSRRGWGRADTWLRIHLWGGLSFLLAVLTHTGLRLPEGHLAWWLWSLSLWTALSGIGGLALQRWIPRVLTSATTTEIHVDRIDDLVKSVRTRAGHLVGDADPALRSFFHKKVSPLLSQPNRGLHFLLDPAGGIQGHLAPFRYLEQRLPAEERGRLEELEELVRVKLEMDVHKALQGALRGWLALHTPPALLLLVLVGLHAFTVLYY